MYEFHGDKRRYFDMTYEVTKNHIVPYIDGYFPIKQDMNVLEIGCGEAGVLKAFLEKGCRCTGIELDPSRIEYAKEFLKDKPKFNDVAKDFVKFIYGKKLVIHNAEFDLAFLNKELKQVGEKQISSENIIDTLNVAREKFPGAQNSLDALCKRFKIDNSRRQKHSALLDCELLAKVYIELFEKKEPTFEFDLNTQDDSIKNVKSIKDRKQIIVQITEEEKRLHKEFLKRELPKSSMLN